MSKPSRGEREIEKMLAAYLMLIPNLPFIWAALLAEQQAPGFGAEAVCFRQLRQLVEDAEAQT